MSLTASALKRPIAVTMFFLGLVLLGFLSWQRLPLELIPNINYPQLTIVTSCENVAPLEMESLVTKKVEDGFGDSGPIAPPQVIFPGRDFPGGSGFRMGD